MRRTAVHSGVLLVLAIGCRNARESSSGQEPEKLDASARLERVQGPRISLSEAIRLAGEHERGFVPVAAGATGVAETGGASYSIALLSHGRVKEVAVDPESGEVSAARERPVREGHEDFAADLEKELPAATLDLSRAVGLAISRAAAGPGEGRALGAEIDLREGKLLYVVTVGVGSGTTAIVIDARTGTVVGAGSGRGEPGESAAFDLDFDAAPAGLLPQGWKVEATGQAEPLATWRIVADATAPSKGHALALVSVNHDSTDVFNLCWTDAIRFLDGSIEASFKPMSGTDDQGGGLIWRARDKDDYYVCRANPLEDDVRLFVVQDGRRTQLAAADAQIAAGAWHTLRIEHEGEHIRCFLDGEKLLETIDETFLGAGGIGFWTKADAVTSFDDLRVNGSAEGREDPVEVEER